VVASEATGYRFDSCRGRFNEQEKERSLKRMPLTPTLSRYRARE
jgi:hypothetical protein